MSHVNNAFLLPHILEGGYVLEKVIIDLYAEHGQTFSEIDYMSLGGHKALEADVYGAAFNYVSIEEVEKAIRASGHEYPMQLLWQGQHDMKWSLFTYEPEGS